MATLRLAGVVAESAVDGPGLRFTVFTQGCPHACPGCHNPQTHDPLGGYEQSVDSLLQQARRSPLVSGATITGGEPLMQPAATGELVRGLKSAGLHVIVYTGFVYEDIAGDPAYADILQNADLLVDGPFVLERRTLELRFRGSGNQRVIDLAKTRQSGAVALAQW